SAGAQPCSSRCRSSTTALSPPACASAATSRDSPTDQPQSPARDLFRSARGGLPQRSSAAEPTTSSSFSTIRLSLSPPSSITRSADRRGRLAHSPTRYRGVLWASAWPGNVRELKHGLESTVFPSDGAILSERPPAI